MPRRSCALLLAFFAVLTTTMTKAEDGSSRTVVEEVTGWLRLYSDGSVDRLTPPGAEPFTAVVPPYDDPRAGVTVHDVPTPAGLHVRLYLREPQGAANSPDGRRRPVLLHFHGGGFCVTRPSWALYHNFYAPLVPKLDVAGIVSVFLPLAPEHRLPAAIDAGHAALLWLRDVARGRSGADDDAGSDHHHHPAVERLRDAADFSRVFLIGDSSGGNLVHLVAARAAGEEAYQAGAAPDHLHLHPVQLAGGVLLHPGFAREAKSRSELEKPPSMFLTEEMVHKFLALALPAGATKDSAYTSPTLAAEAVARLRMPPMLLMVAEQDLLHDTQVEYGEAMARAGKAVETVVSRGDGIAHVFYLNFFAVESDALAAERTRELVDAVKGFIDRH